MKETREMERPEDSRNARDLLAQPDRSVGPAAIRAALLFMPRNGQEPTIRKAD